jgi:hypothetical protein
MDRAQKGDLDEGFREINIGNHIAVARVVAAMDGCQFKEGSNLDLVADRLVAAYNYTLNMPLDVLKQDQSDPMVAALAKQLVMVQSALRHAQFKLAEMEKERAIHRDQVVQLLATTSSIAGRLL